MPGFDRSGPQGMGPMTGGGRGACNPAAAGYGRGMGYGRGITRGFGRGAGMGRGWTGGANAYATAVPADKTAELDMLKADAVSMENGLEMIRRRIEELEKGEM